MGHPHLEDCIQKKYVVDFSLPFLNNLKGKNRIQTRKPLCNMRHFEIGVKSLT